MQEAGKFKILCCCAPKLNYIS